MKKSYFYFFLFVLSIAVNLTTLQFNIYADELEGSFRIEGIPNQNQIDKNVGYFFLKEEPSAKDKLGIKLINDSNKDKTLFVKVVNATTNKNGLIDYTGKLENDNYLETPITKIVTIKKQEFIVPKKSQRDVFLDIKMPNKFFEGIKLGAVVVSEKSENSNQQQQLRNTYSYTLGIVLKNNSENTIKRNDLISLRAVKPILYDGKKIVQADILNAGSYIFSSTDVFGVIYNQETHKKVKEYKMKNVDIAPHTIFPFQLDWGKRILEPGEYTFKVTIKTNEKKWNLSKNFEIKRKEAININSKSVFKAVVPSWINISATIIFILLILGIFILYFREKKWTEGSEENEIKE